MRVRVRVYVCVAEDETQGHTCAMQVRYQSPVICFYIGFFTCCAKLYGDWSESHHYSCFLDEKTWASKEEKVSVESWTAHSWLRDLPLPGMAKPRTTF